MAEKALQKVEEQLNFELNCSICLDTYTDPKLLQCFHVFCRQCLVPLVVRDQQGQLSLSCPTCRQATPIQEAKGVAGLQPAFHINRLLEIKESLQKAETPAATGEGAVRGTTANAPPRDAVWHCIEHPEEEMKLYCETCGELACYKCGLKGGKHYDHDYCERKEAFGKYKEEVTSSLEPMERQEATVKEALAQLDTRCEEIAHQRAATQDSIHITFRRQHEALAARETQLIGKLDRTTQEKLKGLAVQRDQLETTLAQLGSCLHFTRESVREGNEGDSLLMKTNTVRQVKELTTPFQPDTLKPSTEADIGFSASADMTALCQNYGQVFTSGPPDPSKCQVSGKGLEVAAVGEEATALLQAIDYEGKSCAVPMNSLDCLLTSEIAGTRASCSVERRGQSHYQISYQPTIKGRHQLHIKVEGQHIRGSSFSVAVKAPVEKLGTPILTLGGVNRPWGVAISQRGEVVVSELDGHCVSVFSPSGEKLRSFGTPGSGQGQFLSPHGVAVDCEGNVLVVDHNNNRIQKFTAEGQFLTAVGTKGSGPLQFDWPCGIAVNPTNGMVYVVNTWHHHIQVLNSDLTYSSTIGKEGSGKGQFDYLYGIACDSTGKVYVADRGNHRIQVFTAKGKLLRMFGRRGQGRGELDWPYGVAVDSNDMVYVSEFTNHRVSVFTSEGQFVVSFGRLGKGPGEFIHPRGLAVDSSGVVYVCDSRVQFF